MNVEILSNEGKVLLEIVFSEFLYVDDSWCRIAWAYDDKGVMLSRQDSRSDGTWEKWEFDATGDVTYHANSEGLKLGMPKSSSVLCQDVGALIKGAVWQSCAGVSKDATNDVEKTMD